MIRFLSIFLLGSILTLTSCKSSSTSMNKKPLNQSLEEKNRVTISLLNRIRKLPGITMRSGVPMLAKNNNSIQSNNEPLYIIDEYSVGNSFRSANGLVESVNVKKIEVLSSSDASFYGSRAASGVIKITTYQ